MRRRYQSALRAAPKGFSPLSRCLLRRWVFPPPPDAMPVSGTTRSPCSRCARARNPLCRFALSFLPPKNTEKLGGEFPVHSQYAFLCAIAGIPVVSIGLSSVGWNHGTLSMLRLGGKSPASPICSAMQICAKNVHPMQREPGSKTVSPGECAACRTALRSGCPKPSAAAVKGQGRKPLRGLGQHLKA